MSAPRAEWIGMDDAVGIVRRETRELPATYEPELLDALADGTIRTQRTIQYTSNFAKGDKLVPLKNVASELETKELQPSFWVGAPSRTMAMREPIENEYWSFEVHYADLKKWLAEPIEIKKARRRIDRATQAIEETVSNLEKKLGRKPSLDEVWSSLVMQTENRSSTVFDDIEDDEDGDSVLIWTDTNGNRRSLTRDALKRRLHRLQN